MHEYDPGSSPMHFRDEPIARMQALSLPMHWSPTWGAHFLYTSSVHNAGGRNLGGEREASGRRAGGKREVRSNCARPIFFLQQGRVRRTKSGHAEKRNTAGVSLLTSCGTNPCPGGWYSSIFQVHFCHFP